MQITEPTTEADYSQTEKYHVSKTDGQAKHIQNFETEGNQNAKIQSNKHNKTNK